MNPSGATAAAAAVRRADRRDGGLANGIPRGRVRAQPAALVLALGLTAGALPAFAQSPEQRQPPPQPLMFPETLIQGQTRPAPARSQRAAEPLPPGIALRVLRALDLRASGLPDRARDTLVVLLREQPHHPVLVTELGRTHVVREDWNALERLAVSERSSQRDSTLLGLELASSYERLGKPRDAMKVAVQAWTASPADGGWASALCFRLAPLDPKLATDLLEAASSPRPWRSDLAVGLARLHALAGRPSDAVRVLADAEKRSGRNGLRAMFADEALRTGRAADTSAALAALTHLAGDESRRPDDRLVAGRQVWTLALSSGREAEWAPRLAEALRGLPGQRWGAEFLLGVVRTLHRTGRVPEARALLAANPGLEQLMPELALEQALGAAREGDLARSLPLLDTLTRRWPPARFMLAEVQFFAGQLDSAYANFDRVAKRPEDPNAGAALDRLYLLEEHPKSELRPLLGRIAFERWRGGRPAAIKLADSLWRLQAPRGEYAAHAGIELAELRLESGDARGALAPLLVIADSLAADRLAPLARQRAGDAYAALGDDRLALAQYEECLARYPRAWNSAEVRRRVEKIRRARS